MDNVQNCDSYINIPSSQTYRSFSCECSEEIWNVMHVRIRVSITILAKLRVKDWKETEIRTLDHSAIFSTLVLLCWGRKLSLLYNGKLTQQCCQISWGNPLSDNFALLCCLLTLLFLVHLTCILQNNPIEKQKYKSYYQSAKDQTYFGNILFLYETHFDK
jgi:hypothetical protein